MVNAQSWEFYDQQPWEFFRWWIYPSQDFHDENVNKTVHPSHKKPVDDTQKTINTTFATPDIHQDPGFIPYCNALLERLFQTNHEE